MPVSSQIISLINRGKTSTGSCVMAEHSLQRRCKTLPETMEPAAKHSWLTVVPATFGKTFPSFLPTKVIVVEVFLVCLYGGRLAGTGSISLRRLGNFFACILLVATYRGLKPPISFSFFNKSVSLGRTHIGSLKKRRTDTGGSLDHTFRHLLLVMTFGRRAGEICRDSRRNPRLGETSMKSKMAGRTTNSFTFSSITSLVFSVLTLVLLD